MDESKCDIFGSNSDQYVGRRSAVKHGGGSAPNHENRKAPSHFDPLKNT